MLQSYGGDDIEHALLNGNGETDANQHITGHVQQEETTDDKPNALNIAAHATDIAVRRPFV